MEYRENPMLNPLIISHIVDYVTFEDKKAFRFVCLTWNDEIRKIIRKLSRVRIGAGGDKTLENFLAIPFEKTFTLDYSFGPGVKLEFSETEDDIINQFFTGYGPSIKSLSINNCTCTVLTLKRILFDGCPNLESLTFVATTSGRLFPEPDPLADENVAGSTRQAESFRLLPKLKCLQLNVRSSDLVRNTEFMIDLLSIAPNVETISWLRLVHDEVNYDRNFQLDLEKAWSAQRPASGLTIRDTVYDVAIHYTPLKLSKLSKIESNMKLSNASVIALRDRHLPLKYLDLRMAIDVYGSSLTTLLESLSGSLQALKIEFYPSLLDFDVPPVVKENAKIIHGNFQFPKMEKLKHLLVKRYRGSFVFLKELESLKTFSLCGWDGREFLVRLRKDTDVMNCAGLSLSLELFQVFSEDNYPSSSRIADPSDWEDRMMISEDDIGLIANAFPNLSEVRVKGSSSKRDAWFRCLPNLRTLEETATEAKIGGLKGVKMDHSESCYCYGCSHKLQPISWSCR